jgi:hypothetical protein
MLKTFLLSFQLQLKVDLQLLYILILRFPPLHLTAQTRACLIRTCLQYTTRHRTTVHFKVILAHLHLYLYLPWHVHCSFLFKLIEQVLAHLIYILLMFSGLFPYLSCELLNL